MKTSMIFLIFLLLNDKLDVKLIINEFKLRRHAGLEQFLPILSVEMLMIKLTSFRSILSFC